MLVQGEEEGWAPRTRVGWIMGQWEAGAPHRVSPEDMAVFGRSILRMQCPLAYGYSMWWSPNPLDTVSPGELLGSCSAVVFLFLSNCCAPYSPAWEFYLDTFLSSPQTSVCTSGIRRGITWARRFPLGDCDMLDICLQMHYVQFRTNLSINHRDFSQMGGWTNI